jgi:mRNA interferase MazF
LIRRRQVWWIDFAEPRGSEPGFRHPALVLQRDEVNASRISTVVVCVLTSNRALAAAPGNTLLPRKATGLGRDSVANASQIATVDKGDFIEQVGMVPSPLMRNVERGLRWFLDLEDP